MYHESYRHHKNIDATSDDAGVIREILNFNCIDADLSAGFSGELGRSKILNGQTTNPNFSSESQTTDPHSFCCGSFFSQTFDRCHRCHDWSKLVGLGHAFEWPSGLLKWGPPPQIGEPPGVNGDSGTRPMAGRRVERKATKPFAVVDPQNNRRD